MGSGASASAGEVPGADLRLPVTGLRFTSYQLRELNSYVDTLYAEDQKGRMSMETESAVEALVQRLVDGAGQRDPRFKCCHLIALHRGKKMRSRSLEYLVTLDSLPILNTESEEGTLQDGPLGYGKIRLAGREADKWSEFLTTNGYLCRDKLIERWVELVARCAQSRGGGASRVTCARAQPHAAPYKYCYLERVSHQATLERRLAIVEGASWVMVRVGAGEAEAKLMLGGRVGGCSAAAYTTKVPLTHPLALLHYSSAQMGYYAVAAGPPSTIVCAERSSTWQLWHPYLEASLDAHFSDQSNIARIAGALNALVDKMREGCYQGSAQLLSRYAAWCALRRRLERCAAYRSAAARACVSAHAAHHLLLVLDELVAVCEGGSAAGYVYATGRGALARRGARGADWRGDAAAVRGALQELQLRTRAVGEEAPASPSECLEAAMFGRWEGLAREARCAGAASHSRRQLAYLSTLARELLTCKKMVVYEHHSTFRANLIQATAVHLEAIEELVHILAIMLDQARDLYLNNFHTRTSGEFDRELSTYRSKKWNKLKDYYDASSACLIDAVRRDPDLRREDLNDEVNVMKNILTWLYKGAKEDKKYLGPVLRPFLEDLFVTSLENSWFLEEFAARKCEGEFRGLREYCRGVHAGGLEPCLGLLDAAKKFAWAKAMVDIVDRYRHIDFRLIFPTGDGLAVSYAVKLPSRREHSSARFLTLSRRDKAEAKLRLAKRCVLGAFHSALVGNRFSKIARHGSTEEILESVKTGNFWRNSTKPDIIPSQSNTLDLPKIKRRSRRSRPATSYGFPEISITDQSDAKTLRKKYHTLKSLVYTEPVESIREMKQRPRSAGSTVRNKDALSRPSLLETLDFINSVKDALCVEESAASDAEETAWGAEDEWVVARAAPLGLLAARSGAGCLHLMLGDHVAALLQRGKFTILQELCPWLGDKSDGGGREGSEGALFALHRLARAGRARSSERPPQTWKLPEVEGPMPVQRYRAKPQESGSGDEAPQPPPLPRLSRDKHNFIHDYPPPRPSPTPTERVSRNTSESCTGIINPIYDIKMPRDKFSVKRTKSLGRSFSSRNLGIEITRYNVTLGHRNGRKTNDVVTAITGTTGETGLDVKGGYFQRYGSGNVVGDSYKISRVTID